MQLASGMRPSKWLCKLGGWHARPLGTYPRMRPRHCISALCCQYHPKQSDHVGEVLETHAYVYLESSSSLSGRKVQLSVVEFGTYACETGRRKDGPPHAKRRQTRQMRPQRDLTYHPLYTVCSRLANCNVDRHSHHLQPTYSSL
jgi:hypothetical protein